MKFYSQKLENVGKALKFVRDEGVKLVAIGPEGMQHNTTLVKYLTTNILLIFKNRYCGEKDQAYSGTHLDDHPTVSDQQSRIHLSC